MRPSALARIARRLALTGALVATMLVFFASTSNVVALLSR
jgi:hypothetical protein